MALAEESLRGESLPFKRFVALEVDRRPSCLSVRALEELPGGGSRRRRVDLEGDWAESPLSCGDVFHVIAVGGDGRAALSLASSLQSSSPVRLGPASGLLVLSPDTLLSPTRVADGVGCDRRPVVSALAGGGGAPGAAAVLGTLKHVVVQDALELRFSEGSLDGPRLRRLALARAREPRTLEQLLASGVGDAEAAAAALSAAEAALLWVNGAGFEVSALLGVEDSVWAPVVGLTGSVDATVRDRRGLVAPFELKTGRRRESTLHLHRAQVMLYTLLLRARFGAAAAGEGLLAYLSPAEEGAAPRLSVEAVAPQWSEVRSLVMGRNRVAKAVLLAEGGAPGGAPAGVPLPPMAADAQQCERCFSAAPCMALHAALEGGGAASATHAGVFRAKAAALSDGRSRAFLADWLGMLRIEGAGGARARAEGWVLPAPARERGTRKALSRLRLAAVRGVEDGGGGGGGNGVGNGNGNGNGNGVGVGVEGGVRVGVGPGDGPEGGPRDGPRSAPRPPKGAAGRGGQPTHDPPPAPPPARGGGLVLRLEREEGISGRTALSVGDRAMLSSGGHIGAAAASGAAQHVNLAAVRILKLEPAAVEVEAPAGLWLPRVGRLAGPSPGGGAAAVAALSRDTFRLDLDAGTASLRSLRANLLRLFVGDDPSAPPPPPPPGRPPPPGLAPERGCPRLRALLVEGARPAFLPEAEGLEAALSARGAPAGLLEELGALNGDQRRAVALCLRARDYAVVVGFPGTGKSETLALLARLLAATGKRVLLTAYTHAAVDSLVRKAAAPSGADGRVLRVGAPGAVAPDNRRFLLNGDGACGSTRALRERLGAASVVGATALAASSHPLLGGAPAGARPPFDVAIVDEAGQALLPAVLGPLRLARAFVLCGDHYQLPPIVREREARDRGLARSLLRRLCTEQPAACARLALQYRMCEPVMACANALVYGGQLKCAAPRVAAQRLRRAAGAAGLPPWLAPRGGAGGAARARRHGRRRRRRRGARRRRRGPLGRGGGEGRVRSGAGAARAGGGARGGRRRRDLPVPAAGAAAAAAPRGERVRRRGRGHGGPVPGPRQGGGRALHRAAQRGPQRREPAARLAAHQRRRHPREEEARRRRQQGRHARGAAHGRDARLPRAQRRRRARRGRGRPRRRAGRRRPLSAGREAKGAVAGRGARDGGGGGAALLSLTERGRAALLSCMGGGTRCSILFFFFFSTHFFLFLGGGHGAAPRGAKRSTAPRIRAAGGPSKR